MLNNLLLKIIITFSLSLYATHSWSYLLESTSDLQCKGALTRSPDAPLWTVGFTNKSAKQERKLLPRLKQKLDNIIHDLERFGSSAKVSCGNFSKLTKNRYGEVLFHCHITYRYSLVWRVADEEGKFIEVVYVGSREKAPY